MATSRWDRAERFYFTRQGVSSRYVTNEQYTLLLDAFKDRDRAFDELLSLPAEDVLNLLREVRREARHR
jgi:hypothetical protein